MDKILVILIGWTAGFLMLKYRYRVKNFTGEISFAEKYLGSGGTTTFIIILAILLIIGSLMYALGTLDAFFQKSAGRIF